MSDQDKGRVIGDCVSCEEERPLNECPHPQRPCGHHCNHMWTHDACCWCEEEWGEEES